MKRILFAVLLVIAASSASAFTLPPWLGQYFKPFPAIINDG